MSKHAVEVKNVKKSFFLPHHKNNSIKSAITQAFKPKVKGGNQFNALNGISFNVEKGDFFGILGRNGSGKSTLLKIISEIYQPTSGSVKHDGKVVSFIELGVGFKAELSGRENVYLNGGLLGFSKQEVDEMYDEIVGFAELEEFMDQKLKNYSSGMKVRLAFSVAIRAKADILILDEVLAVGDAAFQRKCHNYFRTLKNDGKTVILVTHGMGAVRDFCNKAIVIEGGEIIFEGGPDKAADKYLQLFTKPEVGSTHLDSKVEVAACATVSSKAVDIDIDLKPLQDIIDPMVAILVRRGNEQVIRWVSDEDMNTKLTLEGDVKCRMKLSLQNIFPVGRYKVDVAVKSVDREVNYATYTSVAEFDVENSSQHKYRTLWRPEQTFMMDKAKNEK